jgi:hypothetical protein
LANFAISFANFAVKNAAKKDVNFAFVFASYPIGRQRMGWFTSFLNVVEVVLFLCCGKSFLRKSA